MNWEQKFQAMQALLIFKGDAAIHMRHPGDWCVSLPSVDIKSSHFLQGVSESGKTPEEAVNNTWNGLVDLKSGTYIVTNAYKDGRRAVKWNGFMWEDVKEDK